MATATGQPRRADALRLGHVQRSHALWLGLAALAGAAIPRALGVVPPTVLALLPPALLVLCGVLVLAFARPGLVLVAAFALLSVVRSEPAPSDLLFALLLLTTVLARGRPRVRLPPVLSLALVAFALLSLLSSVNAVSTARALSFEGITLYLLLLGVWLTSMFVDRDLTRACMKAYVVTAAVSGLVGLLAVKVGFPGAATFRFDPERAMGLFKDPNVFGPFMVPAAAIVLEELGRPRLLGWSRRRLLATLACLLAGVVFAFSRAGWLNLAVALAVIVLVYAWRRGGMRVAVRTGAVIVLCGLTGFGFLAATGSLGFLQQRAALQSYDQQRFGTQDVELARATRHVIGYGPGQSETTLGHSTHSTYVRVVYEQGLPGEALLILVLGLTTAAALGLALRDGDVHGVGSAALLGSWLGLLANSFFVDTLHWRHLWVLAALIWLGAYGRRELEQAAAATV